MKDRPKPQWDKLLKTVLSEPGTLSTCYRQFHRFSFLNQIQHPDSAGGRRD